MFGLTQRFQSSTIISAFGNSNTRGIEDSDMWAPNLEQLDERYEGEGLSMSLGMPLCTSQSPCMRSISLGGALVPRTFCSLHCQIHARILT